MRITTGKYKSRLIQMPKGIRPTQDKVRKALFDILGDIEGLSFLELFAGSGAVGLEALSRGVAKLVLVEYNRDCLMAMRKNIDSLQAKSCSIYPQETMAAVKALYKDSLKFDLIFLDPPYNRDLAKKTLQTLSAYDILAPNGLIAVQHSKRENLPETLGVFLLFKQNKYADTILTFYKKAG